MADNRFGLDDQYFRLWMKRVIPQLVNMTPSEAARELARMSRAADAKVMHEPEFAAPLIERAEQAERERDALAFQSECREGLVRRAIEKEEQYDTLAAHTERLRAELEACQSILFQLANAGEVTMEYAADAKAVLDATPAQSLDRLRAKHWREAIGYMDMLITREDEDDEPEDAGFAISAAEERADAIERGDQS